MNRPDGCPTHSLSGGWRRFALCVAGLHVVGLLLWLPALPGHPILLGMGLLAYTFGLRHALDADHIAAVDNTVRKLTEQRRDPSGVGFFFALGHSTVVILTAIATTFAMHWVERALPGFEAAGGVIGGTVSGLFLLIVGFINFAILGRTLQLARRAGTPGVGAGASPAGPLTALLWPLFRFVSRSWHVYPIGFLFGLGFDTASEIALLSMSASAAHQAVPVSGLTALPILFSAGMTLLDTADGVWMASAYRWAFADPVRKLRYNLTVTSISVAAAITIGVIELVQVWSPQMGLNGGIWKSLQELDIGPLGVGLILVLAAIWGVTLIASRASRRRGVSA
ncbi:HoxN/HupN/NixA family nickel/cobalt transporter [Alicyclobacillus macrosporangiidus]|uniref:Nickel/cobalt efflux system n=1 Tax=Alicyclobacillus macrosporangiidus TaxID=392015 RepID=A0A1I7HXN4_9BACL|nr:HoxN/HupN/NixA family nickel/cobalt transporter [Alicyclobacillus macrosporangiidus]SFU65478.1 high-affinity nickel-transport protein [Alicyclobacillus macrosporangiidus]